jgi:hypothetical protein
MSRASASAPERRRVAARCVARFSRLGEHGAIWLALGAAASALDAPEQRPQWRRATAAVAGAYALNTALKLVVRRPRPAGQSVERGRRRRAFGAAMKIGIVVNG